ILAVLLNSRCRNVITGVFGHTYKTAQISNGNILANVAKLRQMDVGHATNGYLVIENLIKRKQEVDKVMIFTDCQLWNSNWGSSKTIEQSWNQYKKIAPNAKLYIFDLAGYGNSPLNTLRSDVTMIGGWSDKIFDVLHAVENGSTAIKEIEKIQI
ncbi:MAG: TROVE domain-containing protein, partial [Bacteroidetes bacterium]|nr:TROVE domain-containing protein [Bacteroidota bacterium]